MVIAFSLFLMSLRPVFSFVVKEFHDKLRYLSLLFVESVFANCFIAPGVSPFHEMSKSVREVHFSINFTRLSTVLMFGVTFWRFARTKLSFSS